MYGDEATVRKIPTQLGDTWAIVGLSSNRRRAAYGVAEVLQCYGKRIVRSVRPTAETVHGEQGYASLADVVVRRAAPGRVPAAQRPVCTAGEADSTAGHLRERRGFTAE